MKILFLTTFQHEVLWFLQQLRFIKENFPSSQLLLQSTYLVTTIVCVRKPLFIFSKLNDHFLAPIKNELRYKMVQKISTKPSSSCIMLEMNKLCSSLRRLVCIDQLRLNILRNCRMFHIFHSEFTFSLCDRIINTQILVPRKLNY